MCAVSFSLSFSIFYFISNRLLNHLKLSSSIRPPLLRIPCHQLVCCKALKARLHQVCMSAASNFHSVFLHCHLRVSGGLSGPLRRKGSRAASRLRSPAALVSLQDLTADTHMVLITRRDWRIWWKKALRVTLASKFYNRAVTLLSGICSPVAQQAGNNGMGDGGSQGWSFPLSPSPSPSLTLFLAVVV